MCKALQSPYSKWASLDWEAHLLSLAVRNSMIVPEANLTDPTHQVYEIQHLLRGLFVNVGLVCYVVQALK